MHVLSVSLYLGNCSTQKLFMNNKKGISMCDTEDCGIELQEQTPGTQQTVNMDETEPTVLEKRFIAYFKHSITEPMDVHRVVLDLTTECMEKDQPMYLLLTDGTVLVCRNFDVIIRDMAPVQEVFDLLQFLEEQMMDSSTDKPQPVGYQ